MKKILMAAAIAGAFVAAPASAQWYVGGGVGSAQAKLGTASASSGGVTASVQGNSSSDTSYKIYGGYQFTPNWGVEAQYVNLGKYNYSITSNVAGVSGSGSYKPESWGLAGTGTLPLSNNFYLMGKLGVAFNKVRDGGFCVSGPGGSACGNVGNGNKTDLLAGLGVGYNFNKNIGVRVEYENFGKMSKGDSGSGNIKGDNWAVSLKYSF
jgi:OOP family OmpA-OmpF porin